MFVLRHIHQKKLEQDKIDQTKTLLVIFGIYYQVALK